MSENNTDQPIFYICIKSYILHQSAIITKALPLSKRQCWCLADHRLQVHKKHCI